MIKALRVFGTALRLLALVWIVSVVLSVATAAEGFTQWGVIAPALAFHGVTAVLGVQLVGLSRRATARQSDSVVTTA